MDLYSTVDSFLDTALCRSRQLNGNLRAVAQLVV